MTHEERRQMMIQLVSQIPIEEKLREMEIPEEKIPELAQLWRNHDIRKYASLLRKHMKK